MADQQINLKPSLSDAQVGDDSKIVPWAVGATGFMNKATVAQIKKIMSVQKYLYTATGSEGTTITIGALASMYILSIHREGSCMYEVVSAPDSVSFIWNGSSITLGLATSAGERFLIQYKFP